MNTVMLVLSSVFDVILVHYVYSNCLVRKSNKTVLRFSMIVFTLLMVGLSLMPTNPNVNLILHISMMLIYSMINFKINIYALAFFTLMYILVVQIGDFFSFGMTMLVLGRQNGLDIMNSNAMAMGIAFVYLFMFTALLLFYRLPNTIRLISSKSAILVSFVPLFTALFSIGVIYYLNSIQELPPFIYLIFAAFFLIVLFFVVLFYRSISQAMIGHTEKVVLENRIEQLAKQYQVIDNTFNELRIQRHNTRHHYNCIKALADSGKLLELKEYMDILQTQTDSQAVPGIISGNLIVDTIIEVYRQIAADNRISFEYAAQVPDKIEIETADLCIVLSNALDNAFESCMEISEGHSRHISLKIYTQQLYLLIDVQNTIGKKPVTEGSHFLTTKRDKDLHGLGLPIVDMIAKKYNGHLDTAADDTVFSFTCMVQMKARDI